MRTETILRRRWLDLLDQYAKVSTTRLDGSGLSQDIDQAYADYQRARRLSELVR